MSPIEVLSSANNAMVNCSDLLNKSIAPTPEDFIQVTLNYPNVNKITINN